MTIVMMMNPMNIDGDEVQQTRQYNTKIHSTRAAKTIIMGKPPEATRARKKLSQLNGIQHWHSQRLLRDPPDCEIMENY